MPESDQPDGHQTAAVEEELRDDLVRDSDGLLEAVDRLRQLELEKRKVRVSTPEFHRRADEIEQVARGVFGLSQRQTRDGERFERTQPTSIDDEAADNATGNGHVS